MKGKPDCLQQVAELYFLCAELDVEVEVVWFPRDTPWQQAADALSKYTDGSQWLLNQAVYDSLWDEPCLRALSLIHI